MLKLITRSFGGALVAVALALSAPALAAQKTPGVIKAESASKFPPNGRKLVAAPQVNESVQDLADSFIPILSTNSNCFWKANGASPATCEAAAGTTDASLLTSGTLNAARLPATVAHKNVSNTWGDTQIFAVMPRFVSSGCYVKAQGLAAPATCDSSFAGSAVAFSQGGTGAASRTVDARLKDTVHAADFTGLDATGASDSRAALQNALDLNPAAPVYLGPGAYRLDDMVTVNNGQTLHCAGPTKTVLKIDAATFNMSALGVIRLGTGEPGGRVRGCGLEFVQPDTSVRASLNAYPPAIYAVSAPRFSIDEVRITGAMTGVKMTGNSGGAIINNLEISAFDKDIEADGSLDSVRLTNVHHWVFGITTNQRSIYSDSSHYLLHIGRVDNMHISNWLGFSVPHAMYFWNGAGGGGSFVDIVNADFDDRGGFWIDGTAPRIRMTNSFFSMGKTDSQFINMNGGRLTIVNPSFEYGVTPLNPLVALSGASPELTIVGGRLIRLSNDASFLQNTASAAFVDIGDLKISQTATFAYSNALFDFGSATGFFRHNHVITARSSGSGDILSSTDTTGKFHAADNILNGWTQSVTYAASAIYGGNRQSIVQPSSGAGYLVAEGETSSGRVQLSTGAADGSGVGVGSIEFVDKNSTQAEKRRASISATLDGSTGTKRGGKICMQTASDSSNSLANKLCVGQDGKTEALGAFDADMGARTPPITVANLPTCNAAAAGLRHFVSDATQTLTAGIGAVVAGGGANAVPVVCEGASGNWRIGG